MVRRSMVFLIAVLTIFLFTAGYTGAQAQAGDFFKSQKDPLVMETVMKQRNDIIKSLADRKENLKFSHKKLSTDLLQLIDNEFMSPGQSRDDIKRRMRELKQIRSSFTVPETVYPEPDHDLVYVYIFVNPSGSTDIIDSYAYEVTDRDEENHLAVAWVEISQLTNIAKLEAVRAVRTVTPPQSRTGSVNSEGDTVHRADLVRSLYGQNGSGVKVGVVSDGVDNWTDARDSGDLPANLTVLSNAFEGDEGTAILEIVYDLAPEAQLYFHDCGTNVVAFNSAIDALVAAGCRIIVDDIGWIAEPFFEDGIVAQHVAFVLASNNVVYVSAAGNDAENHYQGNFYNDGGWHDFSSGTSDYKSLYVNIPPGGVMLPVMEWNDRFGLSGNNYDLYFWQYGTSNLLAWSNDPQNGDGNPLEAFIYSNGTTSNILGEITAYKVSGSSKTLELYIYTLGGAYNYLDNITSTDSIFGHPAVPEVIAVGAIDYPDNNQIAYYSSQGPVTISYPFSELRNKPDVCGMSNVQVKGVGGFGSPFAGTSAAAPHVAAIAALTWAEYPDKTAAEIRDLITSQAVDLGAAGFDYVYGNGRADALKSVQGGDTTPPVYETAAISGANKVVTLTFSENLVDNTGNLKAAVTFAADGTNFIALGPDDSVAISNNTLVVNFNNPLGGSANKIKIAANALKDEAGNILTSEVITAEIAGDTTPPAVVGTDPSAGAVCVPVNQVVTITFNEPVVLGTGGITLKKGDTVISVTYDTHNDALTIIPVSDLDHRTEYTVSVLNGAVRDLAGNAIAYDHTFSFTTVPNRSATVLAVTTPSVQADGDRYRLGSVRIVTSAGSVYLGAAGEVDLYLPDGFEFDWDALQTDPDGIIEDVDYLIDPVDGGCFEDNGFEGAVFKVKKLSNNGIKLWLDLVTDKELLESHDGCLFLTLKNILVPVGAEGDILLTLSAPCTSGFPSASMVVGRCVVGQVAVSVPTIPAFSDEVSVNLRFHENSPKAFKPSTESLIVQLPIGFAWKSVKDPYIIAGNNGWLEKVVFRIKGRDLTIDTLTNEAYETASRVLFGVMATFGVADINEAEYGYVTATFGGLTPATPPELIVARYVDGIPPNVVVTDPLPGATDVPINSVVTVNFSEPVVLGDNAGGIALKKGESVVAVDYKINNNVLTVDPVSDLEYSVNYTVFIPAGAVEDLSGNLLASEYVFDFTTEADTYAPTVTGVDPANGAVSVPITKTIAVSFSEPVVLDDNAGGIALKKGETVVDITYGVNNKVLAIDPVSNLEYTTSYIVYIPAGAVKDLAGNALATSYTFVFTTVAQSPSSGGGGGGGGVTVDTEPPKVTGSQPVDGATDIPVNTLITINFSEEIKEGSTYNSISLKDAEGETISLNKKIDVKSLTLQPVTELGYGTKYTVNLPTGAVKDVKGNAMDQNFILTFTTKAAVIKQEAPIQPAPVPVAFSDMQGHWAAGAVASLVGKGILAGFPDGTFRPDRNINRAEVTAILVRVMNLVPGDEQDLQFNDNAKIPGWARSAVAAAVSDGLVKGYPNPNGGTDFKADRLVSRAELAAFLARIIEKKTGVENSAALYFADAGQIAGWARDAVSLVYAKGIIGGYPDNTFRAQNTATRAEAASMIARLIDYLE